MNNNNAKEKTSKCVILTEEEFEALRKEIVYYKKTIEELQDELDSIEAEKIKRVSKGTKSFRLEEYVSDKHRSVGSKGIKKTSSVGQGKSRKVYS